MTPRLILTLNSGVRVMLSNIVTACPLTTGLTRVTIEGGCYMTSTSKAGYVDVRESAEAIWTKLNAEAP